MPAETEIHELGVTRAAAHELYEAGEEDLFRFTVTEGGSHMIDTSGSTDVVMALFGPESQTLKIAEDGDVGRNSRIAVDLSPGEYGEYFVAARHFNPDPRGVQDLWCKRSDWNETVASGRCPGGASSREARHRFFQKIIGGA